MIIRGQRGIELARNPLLTSQHVHRTATFGTLTAPANHFRQVKSSQAKSLKDCGSDTERRKYTGPAALSSSDAAVGNKGVQHTSRFTTD